jgi:hypothetical protein
LEGPENGVYIRGNIKYESTYDLPYYEAVIALPEYWTKLVDDTTVTVQLTAVNHAQPNIFIKHKNNQRVIINSTHRIDADFVVYAERCDIAKLVPEEKQA